MTHEQGLEAAVLEHGRPARWSRAGRYCGGAGAVNARGGRGGVGGQPTKRPRARYMRTEPPDAPFGAMGSRHRLVTLRRRHGR